MLFTIIIFIFDISSLTYFSYAWISGLYFGVIFALCAFYKKYYNKYLKNESVIWDKQLIKEISQYAFLVFMGASISTLLSQMDIQMVIYLLGTTDAGYYTNYLSIITIPFLVITPIINMLFPVFSELNAKKKYSQIKTIKKLFVNTFIIIGIFSNLLLFIFGENIAYTMFGFQYITSGEILQYSVLLLVFNFLLQINFHILAGTGRVVTRLKIIGIAVIFNFFLNVILINLIGVYGAALATGCGWILIWLLSEIALGKKYFVGFNYKNISKNIFLIGLLGYVSHLYVLPLLEGLNRINSFVFLLIVAIVWSIYFIIINIKDFKVFIQEIKKIKGKK
ncbi:polysaccharide biosynthesis C-terminal domain-containing protein, partial [Candidatus Gracilibacteria bacterium]|nr:polysaccharide biosynthesis C-terminal domain-containing protein [Candidatus Gracilibacteria bacterium]